MHLMFLFRTVGLSFSRSTGFCLRDATMPAPSRKCSGFVLTFILSSCFGSLQNKKEVSHDELHVSCCVGITAQLHGTLAQSTNGVPSNLAGRR
jgi:hypothetical protein